jgi:hypothetical protein
MELPLDVVQGLRGHYADEARSQSQVYDWIMQVKLGRTDLPNNVSHGRSPDESLATVIANKIERDSHLSA